MARIISRCSPACGPFEATLLVSPPCPPCAAQSLVPDDQVQFIYEPPTLTVILRDEEGNPLAGQAVDLHITIEGGPVAILQETTDENGEIHADIPPSELGPTTVAVFIGNDEIGRYVIPQSGAMAPENIELPAITEI